MLLAILAIQAVLLVIALLLRRPAQPERVQPDPRQLALPEEVTRLHGKQDALETGVRMGMAELRRELGEQAQMTRDANSRSFLELRGELNTAIAQLGQALTTGLAAFRQDNVQSATRLQADVHQQHEAIAQRLGQFASDARQEQNAARESLHARLTQLLQANTEHQDRLRSTVSDSLAKLNTDNTAKLEEMRVTVDEKLNATLHTRLTQSFGQVTDQLNKVHAGLGEMSKLSEGVDDLSRIFSNVKSRGGFAEVQLGMLLEQMLAPGQFVRNARIKPNSLESVEFAVRFPGHGGEPVLLPIDAKFPREAWERLESAYEANDAELLASAGKAFEAAIRTEGKRICEKYIDPPVTTPHAIMFLPTEGLYAEVMRRDALQAEIQQKCQVTIAGPSTLSAILTSFQMGFHMLALQGKGDQIRKVLESAKVEFGKFEVLMSKVEGDVLKVQKTLGEVGVRTRAINRTLREVSDTGPNQEELPGIYGGASLRLVAAGEDTAS